jgi:hypothetical protein
MLCSKCNKNWGIVNKKYNLCDDCNYVRLHGKTKQQVYLERQKKRMNNKEKTNKVYEVIARDERLYEYWFNLKPCRCEECRVPLPTNFRNKEGKVIERYQYSHIISKGSAPHFRWHKRNGNKLCLKCHIQWETGDRKSMNIYNNNMLIIQEIIDNPKDLIE